MKVALGKKLWLHYVGNPNDIIISSHGCRYADKMETFDLKSYLPGTTLKFVVPDGVASTVKLTQSIDGGNPVYTTYSYDNNPILFDYYLSKFQESHIKSRRYRHNQQGLSESYADIAYKLGQKSQILADPALIEKQKTRNEKDERDGFQGLVKDFVSKGIITIRSGGRFSQQEVLLSEVIRAAQTPPFFFTTFVCNFCRVVV